MTSVAYPCLDVRFVPTENVIANDYNPNTVEHGELQLLYRSILEDGVTQPIVVYHDAAEERYVVVDGFHRYSILRDRFKCSHIPVVVLDLPLAARMAATVNHNRARGKHQIALMETLTRKLAALGWSNSTIAKQLGMLPEEVLRLQSPRGIAAYYAQRGYSRAWEWRRMPDDTPQEGADA